MSNSAGRQPGARDQAALLPSAPGVYRFRDAAGRVLYLGRATALRSRVTSYWGDLGDRAHLSRMVGGIARVEAVACDSVHEAAWLERNLLQARLPPWNRAPDGGQETEVWIRLSPGPAAPGLAVVHQPPSAARPAAPAGDRLFGPCLGGRQARLAAALTAALDRDQAAVTALRSSLAERRDAAAAILAFELAARLATRAAIAG